jgi:triosephosphate isomerase
LFYFGSNTKRDLSLASHISITNSALKISKKYSDSRIFLLPAMPLMQMLRSRAKGSRLWIGNQVISATTGSDVTGEVSAKLVKSLGSDLVLIGHAERRRLFDGDREISSQLQLASACNLRILFCIGESRALKYKAALRKFLRNQLQALARIQTPVIVAYEPVFSIGAGGKPANPSYVARTLEIISEELARLGLNKTPILYGGSVNPDNAKLYAALDYCQGLFVGRSAWSAAGFEKVFLAGYNGYSAKS